MILQGNILNESELGLNGNLINNFNGNIILLSNKNNFRNSPNYKNSNNLALSNNSKSGSQTNEKISRNNFIANESYKTPFKNLIKDLNSVSKDIGFLVSNSNNAEQLLQKIESFENSGCDNSYGLSLIPNNNLKSNSNKNGDNNSNLNSNLTGLLNLNFEKSISNSGLYMEKACNDKANDNKSIIVNHSVNHDFLSNSIDNCFREKNCKEKIKSDFSITDLIDSKANENFLLKKKKIISANNKSQKSNLKLSKTTKNYKNTNNYSNNNTHLVNTKQDSININNPNSLQFSSINPLNLQSPIKIKNKIIISDQKDPNSKTLLNSNSKKKQITNFSNINAYNILLNSQNKNSSGCAANDYYTPLKSSSAKKRIFECIEEFSTANTTQKKDKIKKRLRKSSSQIKYLEELYKTNKDNWSNDLLSEITQEIGLDERKVYKWFWDQKNKELISNLDKQQEPRFSYLQIKNFEKKYE